MIEVAVHVVEACLVALAFGLPFKFVIDALTRDGKWYPQFTEGKMRRWADGKWQYREMTDAEYDEYESPGTW